MFAHDKNACVFNKEIEREVKTGWKPNISEIYHGLNTTGKLIISQD